jgi:NadR type nicotinamide-nucleotide adenylyltransferase
MIKIAFIGPESSGKTTLTNFFCELTSFKKVEEFARKFLEKKQTKYTYEDLEIIAQNQFKLIQNTIDKIVWIDTELLVIQIWSEVVFGKTCDFITQNIENQKIDLYVLCKPDIPWEYDVLRENPLDREQLFQLYEFKLKKYNFPYLILEGSLENRTKMLSQKLKELFQFDFIH